MIRRELCYDPIEQDQKKSCLESDDDGAHLAAASTASTTKTDHAVGVPKHNVRAYRFTKHHIHSASCTPPTTLPASFAIKAKESIRSVFESLQSVQFRMLFMHTHYSTEKTWSSFLFSV